jgi:predicted AlkP superfamily pyrophosphatase or phosphodiesterase
MADQGVADRVVLFLVDGMRPDGMQQAPAPTMQRLCEAGASTLTARTVWPSITLPTHTSLFHSVPPEVHGVVTNEWRPVHEIKIGDALPGLIDLIHQANRRAAAFYTWEELRDLWRPGSLAYSTFINLYAPDGEHSDARVAHLAAEYIVREQPDFTFVYLGWTDEIGHRHGWMSPEYLAAIRGADAAIQEVLEALESAGLLETTACLVTADHGGHEQWHGSDCAEDMTIPWMLTGPGVKPGYHIQKHVGMLDTAPTIACLLGLQRPALWQGQPVWDALQIREESHGE